MKQKLPLTIKVRNNKISVVIDGITYVVGSKVLLDPKLTDEEVFNLVRQKVKNQLNSMRVF